MTERNFKDKNGNEWTWEENAEVLEAIRKLHEPQSQEQPESSTGT